jgi:hypothetical protein
MTLFRRRTQGSKSAEDLDPHQWTTATADFKVSPKHPKTVIPDPAIFRDALLPSPDQVSSLLSYPTAGHLAVHLALLECFAKFKDKVVASEDLTLLDAPGYEATGKGAKARQPLDNARAVERWNTVVHLAVSRFTVWFENIEGILRHATAYHRYGADSNLHHAMITQDYLPPLDVLLVWYSYMNGHAEYHNDNISHDTPKLLEIPFPWEAIFNILDMDTLTYRLTSAAERLFYTMTASNSDILIYLSQPPPYTGLDPQRAISLDLTAAVHELMDGNSFIQKMHALLWLRSPSLEGTLSRALAYYAALPEAMGNNTSNWLDRVATEPNLELVWRTHMLYPVVFASFHGTTFGGAALPPLARVSTEEAMFNDDIAQDTACYCWACERIRDELPEYVRSNSPIEEAPEITTISTNDSCASNEKSPSKGNGSSTILPLSALTKDQISEIKEDLSFHHYIEGFRKTRPDGTTLPTRPPTARALREKRSEQESKARAGRYYGTGYTVEVIRPAVYDPATGRLLQKEKTKVKRRQQGPFAGMKMGFA